MTEKRIALVTGGNRGLGFEMCRQLGRRGLTVLLGARDEAKGEAAAGTLRDEGLDVRWIALDVTRQETLERAVTHLESDYGRLDVLVNNAAILTDIGVQPSQTEDADLRANFEVNFFGPYLLTKRLVPLLRKSASVRVVNLGTQVGSFHNLCDPGSPLKDDICPAYQASKIALNAMTALFAKELQEEGIKVNSVCPGWVMTDMGHEDLPDYGDAVRPMSAEEAVAKLLWLTEVQDDLPTGGFFSLGEPVSW